MELKPLTRQWFYASSPILNLFSMGLIHGYPAILLPYLKDKNSDIYADLHVITWWVALPGVVSLPLNVVVGPLINLWGRKKTHLLVSSCGFIGWILAASSYSIYPLFVSRAFHGMLKVHLEGTIIAEFTAPKSRGPLLTIKLIASSLGTAVAHTIGLFAHWRHLALVGVAVSGISVLINICWTETPEWLVLKKKFDKAEDTFYKLRGRNVDTEAELAKMIDNQKLKQSVEKPIVNVFRILSSKPFWKVAVLVLTKHLVLEMGGRHFFPAYLMDTISGITGNNRNSTIYVIALDCVSIIAGLISYIMVRKFSRRTLLVRGGLAGVFIMLSLSLSLFLHEKFFHTNMLMYISAGLIALYYAVVFSSTFTICYVISGELWPLDFRHIGIVYQSLASSLIYATWMYIVPYLKLYLHVYGFLALSAVLMLAALMYMYKYLPETKDSTLHDISEHFQGKTVIRTGDEDQTQTFVNERVSKRGSILQNI